MKTAFRTLAALALLGGCVRHYKPPLESEPHAVVKIRRSYASHAGRTLSEYAFIGEYQVMAHDRDSELDQTQTTAVRVHPGAIKWRVGSSYTHTEMRQVQEMYTVQEPYSTSESYNCGGTTYRTCSRSVTRYRSQTKYRWVSKPVTITDAECKLALRQLADVGHIYLLQYSYTADDICSLVCREQLPRADGQFDTKPCIAPPKAPAE